VRKLLRSVFASFALLCAVVPALAQFNPALSYATVNNACGGIYYLQGSTYYDTHGNSYSTLPACTPVVAHGVSVLAQSGVASSVTGTTTETVLATIPIPAGAMTGTGSLRITCRATSNNTDTKTLNVRIGGVLVFTQNVNNATSENAIIVNAVGATNSQHATATTRSYAYGTTGSPITTSTVDMTQAQNLTITGTLVTTTDTLTLDHYLVELINP
jgi:hypothetical protein